MNLKYTKNIEGKFGFYMNGGLVKPEYVTDTFNSFVYRVNYLDEQITNLKKQIGILEKSNDRIRSESFFLLSAEDAECNFHESSARRNRREKYLKELREGSEK